MENQICDTAKKWYKELNFPEKYDDEFYSLLNEIKSSSDTSLADGKRNLLSLLCRCEDLEKMYAEKGIDRKILLDTLSDIVIWTNTWSDLKSELWLGETEWLGNHFEMRLFKLGRLQFCMRGAEADIPSGKTSKGDNIIEIHIPATGPLLHDECVKSIENAKNFFAKHYPEYEYKYFTCRSWLMDTSLRQIQKPESNILKFQDMFEIFNEKQSDAILKYVFKWDTSRADIKNAVCTSSFSKKVKERALSGEPFYTALGIIKK